MTRAATGSGSALVASLREIVGRRYVLTDPGASLRFRRGFRYGEGRALAVVRPGTLVEQWRAFRAVIAAGRIVIFQAANTGLNGGSTPYGDDYDREVVIINTMRIGRIDLIDGGRQVVCLAGATLHALERLIRPLGREPHSVIGSTTIGASVIGGICNNSGGALIRRGPAFTQLALFARVEADGRVVLVNRLGIALGGAPEEILSRLDAGAYDADDIAHDEGVLASDPDYATLIRDIDSPRPARYNNDPRLLHDVSGSAGKLCVFAVRLDTFPSMGPSRVFYVGSNDHAELTRLRRHILGRFAHLPVAGEYLHRDTYRLAQAYGKDLYLLLRYGGTERIGPAFRMKSAFDSATRRLGLGEHLSDRLLQQLVRLLPEHLPRRLNAFAEAYEHHLLLRTDGEGIAEARAHLGTVFPSETGGFFECDEEEAAAAFRNRYAVGGAAIRYRAVHRDAVEDIVALDLAFPRNALDWRETVPEGVDGLVHRKIICGHFFCHVFHYDYAVRKGSDCHPVEEAIVAHHAARGVEFPAEHNVGHLYVAKPALAGFYRDLDPTNALNPGIGRTSARAGWL